MRSPVRLAAVVALTSMGSACSGGNTASNLATPPEFQPASQTKCGIAKSQARPLIVEWPSADRADLEALARKGIVPVRYQGCEMEVLARCRAPGAYVYAALTRQDDRLTMRDADELYANVPLGAAKLEATLRKSGALNVTMTIVGKYEADRASVRKDELEGECTQATHVITAMTAGAFEFFAGADADVGGGADVLGAGAGGKSSSKREVLNRAGDAAACASTTADTKPPEGCGALLRVEVAALGEMKRREAFCPEGSAWDGARCVHKRVVTEIECPRGTTLDGNRCVADVSVTCEAGLHFEPGRGCVANVVAPPPAAPTSQPTSPSPPPSAVQGDMVKIPGGTFVMPGQDGKAGQEVRVAPFWLDRTEVTVASYEECARAGRCDTAGFDSEGACNWKPERRNHPVNCVSHTQAKAYCAWRNKRLPMAREWVFAAGAADGRSYPWGSADPSGRACWKRRAGEGTCPVESHAAGNGPFGVADMAGNVWEWLSAGAAGGSWASVNAKDLGVASLLYFEGDSRHSDIIGFRCARSI